MDCGHHHPSSFGASTVGLDQGKPIRVSNFPYMHFCSFPRSN